MILQLPKIMLQVGRVFGICEKNLPMRHRDINLLALPFPMYRPCTKHQIIFLTNVCIMLLKSKTWEAQDVFIDNIFQVGCLRVLQNSSLWQNQEKVADILSSLNRISFINRFCTHSNITRLKEKLRGASMLPQVWHFTKHHHHHHQKSQDHAPLH